MKYLAPNYYPAFKCVADKCSHNCCIGWEIEIDKKTAEHYRGMEHSSSLDFSHNISKEGTFVLDENKRCPFLNKNGLCDIIIEYGESSLCDICREHPRFYNFYSDFREVGLGMCCEHAAWLILNSREPFCLEGADNVKFTAEERRFLALRQHALELLQDRNNGILQRVEKLCDDYGFSLSDISLEEVCTLLLSLERLDNSWTKHLEKLRGYEFNAEFFKDENIWIPFEQLMCYLVFRHFNMEKGNYYEAVCFACVGFVIISALCDRHMAEGRELKITDIAEYARMFSSEVEYCVENTEAVMRYFE